MKTARTNVCSFVFVFIIACFAGGCCPCLDKPDQKKPEQKTVAREAIEGFTGKTAVDNLKRAKPKIAAANETGKQKQEDVNELTKP